MRSILLHPRFYLGMILTFATLMLIGLALAMLLIEPPSRYYRTTFFELPIPKEWDCDVTSTEIECRPVGEAGKTTIIIATAKYRGPMDTFEAYRTHLNTPQLIDQGGKAVPSRPVYVRDTILGGRIWIDGRHEASEVPNYDTRYMATITSRLAILATYSIHKNHFDDFERILNHSFERMDIFEPPGFESQVPARTPDS